MELSVNTYSGIAFPHAYINSNSNLIVTHCLSPIDFVKGDDNSLLRIIFQLFPTAKYEDIIKIALLLPESSIQHNIVELKKINARMDALYVFYQDTKNKRIKRSAEIINQEGLVDVSSTIISEIKNDLRNDALLLNSSLRNSLLKLSDARIKKLPIPSEAIPAEELLEGGITTATSYAVLWGKIAEAIGNIKIEYVDFYASLMKEYTDMYQSYSENVQKASSDAVSAGNDGNNVGFDRKVMSKGYEKFEGYLHNIELGKVKNWNDMSPEQKVSMKITLEPAFKIVEDGNIYVNLDQYTAFNSALPQAKGGQVTTATYHAWLASFNTVGGAFQSNMQSFAQRYSQANSTFDNLNKLLSGVISTLAESARDVLKSFG